MGYCVNLHCTVDIMSNASYVHITHKTINKIKHNIFLLREKINISPDQVLSCLIHGQPSQIVSVENAMEH